MRLMVRVGPRGTPWAPYGQGGTAKSRLGSRFGSILNPGGRGRHPSSEVSQTSPQSTPAIEDLLAHQVWVRALARGLVADPNDADDVAQATWLSALRSAPGGRGPGRRWLATVARNAARQLGRGEARRRGHERSAARLEAVEEDDVLERVETQRRLVEHVLSLDEPYRRAILLRYFDDLSPRAIAARTRTPVETVKTRLRRALATLRARLERERDERGRSGLAALMPLAAASGRPAIIAQGVALMSSKTVLGAAAALVLLVVPVLVRGRLAENPHGVAAIGSSDVGADASHDDRVAVTDSGIAASVEPVAESEARIEVLDPDALRLQVVQRDTAGPVPGARVWIAPTSPGYREYYQSEMALQNPDHEVAVRSSGTSWRADDEGIVLLPQPEESIDVVGRSGDLYGQARLFADARSGVLELIPDRSIALQAIDAAGKPVSGIPVGIFFRRNPDDARGKKARIAYTGGEEGLAVLRHLDHILKRDLEPGTMLYARIAGPRRDPGGEVPIELDALPSEPVQLVVGPVGRVVVRVLDPDGSPYRDGQVNLWEHRERRDGANQRWMPQRHTRYAFDGVATFDAVEVGLDVKVRCHPMDGLHPVEAVAVGPATPGEVVEIVLRFERYWPRLSGRLVHVDGMPLVGRDLLAAITYLDEYGDPCRKEGGFATDEDGHFETFISIEEEQDTWTGLILETGEQHDGPRLWGKVQPVPRGDHGVVELGDVVMRPPPVVVAGRVLDDAGEPIYWAGVWAARFRDPDEPPGLPPYTWVPNSPTMTDRDGRFVLTGEMPPGEYRLNAAKTGFLRTDWIPFPLGADGLEVRLAREGGLEGRIILAGGIDPARLAVEVVPSGADLPIFALTRNSEYGLRPWTSGAFRKEGLAAGSYDVRICIAGYPVSIAEITGVLVEEGGVSKDSRLDPIDLTRIVRGIDVDVVDPAGDAVPKGYVTFWPGVSGDSPPDRRVFRDGRISILALRREVDMLVVAPGASHQHLAAVRGGDTVVLEGGIPVRVRLKTDAELPGPPFELVALLVPRHVEHEDRDGVIRAADGEYRGRWSTWSLGDERVVGEDREVWMHAPAAGDYQLRWRFNLVNPERIAQSGSFHSLESDGGRRWFPVEEGGDELVLELTPDPEETRRAIESLRR